MNEILYLTFLFVVLSFLTLIILLLLIFLISTVYSSRKGAPYIPNTVPVIKASLDLASLTHEDVLIDLGSGDGRTLFYAHNNYHVKKSIGYEISPFPYYFSRFIKRMTYKKAHIILKKESVLKLTHFEGNVIYAYLLPELLDQLESNISIFLKNTKDGRVIIPVFEFKHLKPSKIQKIYHPTYRKKINIHLYDSTSL